MPTHHKTLIFDVETAPSLAYIWSPKTRYVGKHMLVSKSFMLTWAAKWEGEDDVYGQRLTSKQAQEQDDAALVNGLARMIDQADSVVAHNGDNFDIKVLNGRLLRHGLDPIPPVKSIDTLKLAKRTFRIEYNNLDYLAEFLGLEGKHSTNFDLWRRCYHGDDDALDEMLAYNEQDVVVLEQVYHKIRPYVKGLPRLIDAEYDGEPVCPICGVEGQMQKRGFYHAPVNTYQRFRCKKCKRWSRARISDKSKRPETVRLA